MILIKLPYFILLGILAVMPACLSAQTVSKDSLQVLLTRYQEVVNTGNVPEAIELAKLGVRLSLQQENDSMAVSHYNNLAEGFLYISQLDSSLEAVNQGLKLAKTDAQRLIMLNMKGNTLSTMELLDEASDSFSEAANIAENLKNLRYQGAILNNLATVYRSRGLVKESLESFEKAFGVAEELKDSSFMAIAASNIGETFNQMDDYANARAYLNRSLEISGKLNNVPNQITALSNLGYVELGAGNFDIAQTHFDRLFELSKNMNDPIRIIRTKFNIGDNYLKYGRRNEARKLLKEVYDDSKKFGVDRGVALAANSLAKLELQEKNFQEALDWAQKALPLAERLQDGSLMGEIFDTSYQAHKNLKNSASALQYLEKSKQISDSLSSTSSQEILAKARARLESTQKEYEIDKLNSAQQIQGKEIELQRSYIVIFIALVSLLTLITSGLVVFGRRQRKSNEALSQLNDDLEKKRKDLERLNREKSELISIVAHDIRTPISSMQMVIDLIKTQTLTKDEIHEVIRGIDERFAIDNHMIQNLLQWATTDPSLSKLNAEELQVEELIAGIVREKKPTMESKHIAIETKISPSHWIAGELDQMKSVIRNVLGNAIKFSQKEGAIFINSREDGAFIDIVIRDEGIGISPDQQKRIFSEVGNTKSGTDNEKGSGLGLYLSKQFVERMKGEISFSSEPGKGTEFIIRMPKAADVEELRD